MRFRTIKVGDYKVKIVPQDNDLARLFYFIGIAVPYFWDSPISFDMTINPIKRNTRKPLTSWKYEWRLYELWNYDVPDGGMVKHDTGEYPFDHFILGRYQRKFNAIKIGYLRPHMNYVLAITFKDDLNHIFDEAQPVTFTVKDRDEYQMNIFLIIFSIFMTILIGFIVKIWGIKY